MDITPFIHELYNSSFEQLVTKLKNPSTLKVIRKKFAVRNHESHENTPVSVSNAVKISTAFLIIRFPNKVFTDLQGTHEIRLYQKAEELIAFLKEHPTVPGHIIDATEFCQSHETWKKYHRDNIEPKIKYHIITLLDLFVQQDTESIKQSLRKQIAKWLVKFKRVFGQEKLQQLWTALCIEECHGLNVEMP